MTTPSRGERLRTLIEDTRKVLLEVWEGLPPVQQEARGEIDHWAPKDHLAHVAFWDARTLARLKHILGGPAPEALEGHFQETNERVFREHATRPASEIISCLETVYEDLLTALDRLPDETLEDRQRFPWTAGRPLWQSLVFTPVYHAIHHVCDVLADQAKIEEARALQEEYAERMAALDPASSWQGTVEYNLACFYALHNLPQTALDCLATAFSQNPDLIDWSKQDPDLDSLRSHPTFQALIEG